MSEVINVTRELITIRNLRAYYKLDEGIDVKAVDGVSLELNEKEILGIAGESGCGKSTLASVLSFNINPPLYIKEGEIYIDRKDVVNMSKEEIRKEIKGSILSVVPQGAMNSLNPTQRVRRLIVDIMKEHYPEKEEEEILKEAKERAISLGLPERVLEAYPHQLSGGMKQRTIIMISTLLNPKILVADEPTSALDVSSQKSVIRMLVELTKKQIIQSVIFITHELPLLRHFTTRIAIMYAGKIVEIGPTEDVIFKPMHPYTEALMASMLVPEPEMKARRVEGIPGVPPDLKNPPKGCRFAPRCSKDKKMKICEEREPEVKSIGGRQIWCWRMQ
ncbi:ABC transporter ATP-binding protein [Caldicellulosiruptoraceae bacterium PP1]